MKASPSQPTSHKVRPGADRLLEIATECIRGKRIGLLTNQTSALSDGTLTAQAIANSGLCKLTTLFGPEHGIRGDAADGAIVGDAFETSLGARVFSLYGEVQKPTPQMLEEVDVFICDIQEVGVRFYTYLTTVALVMEAAAEKGIPFIVLDRPNPINGVTFDGPLRQPSLKSFVGWLPIPITTGLTLGEVCTMCNTERWLAGGKTAELHIVEMRHWRRSMWFDQTGLEWIPPSPNLTTLASATTYPGLCLVEGTNLSEGRGTLDPFQVVGAPWVQPDLIVKYLERFSLQGVKFFPERFTPLEIPGRAEKPKYCGEECHGIRIVVHKRELISPVRLGVAVLHAFQRIHPEHIRFDAFKFDRLAGTSQVREDLEFGIPPDELCSGWEGELEYFGHLRAKYLRYS